MSKRMSVLLVVLTIISGLVGGAISNYAFINRNALAADSKVPKDGKFIVETAKQSKILTVEELRVVSKEGKIIASIGEDHFDKTRKGLFLFNNKELPQAYFCLGINNDEPSFTMVDPSMKFAVFLYPDSLQYSPLKDKTNYVYIGVDNNRQTGVVKLENISDSTISAEMSTNEYGGIVGISGKGSNTTNVSIGVNEKGNGVIGLWDKNGRRLVIK